MTTTDYEPRHDQDTLDLPVSQLVKSRRMVEAAVELRRRPFVTSGVLDGYTAHLALRARHAAEPSDHWTLEDQALAAAQRRADASERARG